jgi:hypothetical protein
MFCQVSTPASPTYLAAVVEYSPDTGSASDTAAAIVSKNVANYILYIQQAAQQVGDTSGHAMNCCWETKACLFFIFYYLSVVFQFKIVLSLMKF